MPYEVDIVVLSNLEKNWGDKVEVGVGLLGNHKVCGVRSVGGKRAQAWFHAAGLKVVKMTNTVPANWKRAVALSAGMTSPLFSSGVHYRWSQIGLARTLGIPQSSKSRSALRGDLSGFGRQREP
jgi:hypothetical protein